MKLYIKASIDIEDYRGYYIAYEGKYYVIYDASDDSKIGGHHKTLEEAEREIDSWFDVVETPTPEQKQLGKELYYNFLRYINVKDVSKSGYIHTDRMFNGAYITEKRLNDAVETFYRKIDRFKYEDNGVYLYIYDNGYNYRICVDYVLN